MHPIEHIRQFAHMTPDIEQSLYAIMQQRSFRKGEIIRGAINIATYAYYIEKGSARVFFTQGGREHTVSFSFDDEFILTGSAILKSHPDTLSIQFLEPTDIVYIPHLKIKDVLEDSSSIEDVPALIFLTSALFRYNSFLEERLYVMQTFNARERYNWAITRYPRLLQTATITQIASFLGLTKETLYRIRHNNY